MYNPQSSRDNGYAHPLFNVQKTVAPRGKKCFCGVNPCCHDFQHNKLPYNKGGYVDNNFYNNYPAKIPVKSVDIGANDNSLMDDFFKIVMIIDESGSMEEIKDKMIKSINDLITEQKQVKERPSTFTLVKFNHTINRVVKNKNLNDMTNLKSTDYIPSGTTALYDAIGDTVNWFKNEKDVLMVIVTDGADNASKKYTKRDIGNMIEEKKRNNNWSYVYLSNDLSTFNQGNNIGLAQSSFSTNCVADQGNYGDFIGNKLNSAISNFRKGGISVQSQLNR